jgi:hypothetical protein
MIPSCLTKQHHPVQKPLHPSLLVYVDVCPILLYISLLRWNQNHHVSRRSKGLSADATVSSSSKRVLSLLESA